MATTLAGVSLSTTRSVTKADRPKCPNNLKSTWVQCPWKTSYPTRRMQVRPMATPERIAKTLEETIKEAEEICASDPLSGECAAEWDMVEEVSAAASHAREREKESDPLENYCKDNPETDECKTYDN
ncbi:calvin cycle protein CP12-2, chloroplastic [Magnolia sinica]|uniref:calvin cycle protein CP12-2, chloroplastic n=1 Tax=Magnolia sinica TaxID=86752 RepID=UPI00265AFCF9|nr:calvin cycle protein CP12-2, chloroplastic [Magnolia sinica]